MLKITRKGTEKEKTLEWAVQIYDLHPAADGIQFSLDLEDLNFLGGVESVRRLFSGIQVKFIPEWNLVLFRRKLISGDWSYSESLTIAADEMGSGLLKEWLIPKVLPKKGDAVFVRYSRSKMPPTPGVVSHFESGMVFVTHPKDNRPRGWFSFRQDVSASETEWQDWREDLTNLIDDLHEVPRTSTGWLLRSFRRWESGTHVSEIVLWIEEVYGKDSVPMTDMQFLYSGWGSPGEDEAFLRKVDETLRSWTHESQFPVAFISAEEGAQILERSRTSPITPTTEQT